MEKYINCFYEECIKREKELQLSKTFDELESGGKEYSYNSIVFCLIDAVFSIGVRYKSVENTVCRYAKFYDLDLYNNDNYDNHTIEDFIRNYEYFKNTDCIYHPSFAKCVLKNEQRTSSKNGILKSKACYDFAKVLNKYGVNTIDDFRNLDNDQFVCLESDVKNVKGQGSGIMFSYFCMLAGDDDTCKPDRWIKKFLEDIGLKDICNNDEIIQNLFRKSCKRLNNKYPTLTTRYLDYQIWSYQRSKEREKNK